MVIVDDIELSVIMPVYNCEKYLSYAVESILNQTYNNWELLICDDGSTDDTWKIITSYGKVSERIRIFQNQKNIGKVETLNKMFKSVSGRYIVFHDADDISSPLRFEKQVHFLDSNPVYGIVGTCFTVIDGNSKVLNSVERSIEDVDIRLNAENESQFHFPTCAFRKEILMKIVPLFRRYFNNNNEDTDLCYRVLSVSKGYNIPDSLYVYRVLSNSISRSNIFRNSYVYYKVVRDMFYQREGGNLDSLELDNIKMLEDKYLQLLDNKSLIYYANAVSFNLSYYMFRRAFKVVYYSYGNISFLDSFKLLIVTSKKSLILLLKYLTLKRFSY